MTHDQKRLREKRGAINRLLWEIDSDDYASVEEMREVLGSVQINLTAILQSKKYEEVGDESF